MLFCLNTFAIINAVVVIDDAVVVIDDVVVSVYFVFLVNNVKAVVAVAVVVVLLHQTPFLQNMRLTRNISKFEKFSFSQIEKYWKKADSIFFQFFV